MQAYSLLHTYEEVAMLLYDCSALLVHVLMNQYQPVVEAFKDYKYIDMNECSLEDN